MPRKKIALKEEPEEEQKVQDETAVSKKKKKDTIVKVEMKEVEEPPKPKSRKKKIQLQELPPPTMLESLEPPIQVKTVHNVCFERFSHDGKFYYIDKERDKLYEYLGSKKHGGYIGRWDSHLQEIIKATEDSDEES